MKVKHSRHNCYAEACIELGYYIKSDSFHQLPRDPDLKKKWIEILKIPERIVNHPSLSKNLKICSNHFTNEDYRMVGQRRMLKLDAVPSKGLEKGTIPTLSADLKEFKRRKIYTLDEEIPGSDVKDTPSVLDKEESKNESPTPRPKRRAAAAAAKKMIEATSTAIDKIIVEKEKEDIKSPTIKQNKDTSSGISIKTPTGQTIYLKNMSVINQVEQKKKTATDEIVVSILNNPMPSSLSITPVLKPVAKARKSFPNSSGRISQLYKATTSSTKFTHSAVTSKNKNHSLDLDMQCFEEGLSPSQISAHNKAVMDYQVVMNKIRKYNQNRNYIVRYEDDPAVPSDVTDN